MIELAYLTSSLLILSGILVSYILNKNFRHKASRLEAEEWKSRYKEMKDCFDHMESSFNILNKSRKEIESLLEKRCEIYRNIIISNGIVL